MNTSKYLLKKMKISKKDRRNDHVSLQQWVLHDEILVKQVVSKAALLSPTVMKFSSFHGNEFIATLINGLVDNQEWKPPF